MNAPLKIEVADGEHRVDALGLEPADDRGHRGAVDRRRERDGAVGGELGARLLERRREAVVDGLAHARLERPEHADLLERRRARRPRRPPAPRWRSASSHMKLARKMLSSPVSSTVLDSEVWTTSGVSWSPARQVTASPNQLNATVAKTSSSSVSSRQTRCMSGRRLAMSVPKLRVDQLDLRGR